MTTPPTPTYPPGYLDETRAPYLIGFAVTFIVVDTVSTILRVLARRLQRQGFMWSDVYMPLSLLFNLGLCTCVFLAVRWGAGRHAAAVPHKDFKPFLILSYYGTAWVYLLAVTFSKLAILDIYLHILIDKASRYISYLTAAVVVLNAVVNIITGLFQCHPFDYLWNPTPGGACNNVMMHFIWASFPNIITDIVMLMLPVPMVIKLQASWQKKLGILVTFLVGSAGLATSIIRFVEFYKYSWYYTRHGSVTSDSDGTWDDAINLAWTVIEPGVYHLAACILTFRPLFRWLANDSPLSGLITGARSVTSLSRGSRSPSQRSKKSRDDASSEVTATAQLQLPARALEKLERLDVTRSDDSSWSRDLEKFIRGEQGAGSPERNQVLT